MQCNTYHRLIEQCSQRTLREVLVSHGNLVPLTPNMYAFVCLYTQGIFVSVSFLHLIPNTYKQKAAGKWKQQWPCHTFKS